MRHDLRTKTWSFIIPKDLPILVNLDGLSWFIRSKLWSTRNPSLPGKWRPSVTHPARRQEKCNATNILPENLFTAVSRSRLYAMINYTELEPSSREKRWMLKNGSRICARIVSIFVKCVESTWDLTYHIFHKYR